MALSSPFVLILLVSAAGYGQAVKAVDIRVLDTSNHAVAHVILATDRKTCSPTDSFGKTQLVLEGADRQGDKLEFVLLAPADFEISSQSVKYIPSDLQVRVILRKSAAVSGAHDEERRAMENAEVDERKAMLQVAVASFAKGAQLFSEKKYDQAEGALKVASALLPQEPKIKNLLGMCYVELHQFSDAKAVLEDARQQSLRQEKGIGPLTRDIDANLNHLENLDEKAGGDVAHQR